MVLTHHRTMLAALAAVLISGQVAYAGEFSLGSLGEHYSVFTRYLAPEKLYLHLDRTRYTSGETVWFNGILLNASPRTARLCSNFIYVELQDADGGNILRVKVKRNGYGFPGNLVIPDNIKTGSYTVRAYTLAQTSRDSEYMFNQKIEIIGAEGRKSRAMHSTAAETIDVTFYPEGGRWFYGNLSNICFKAMDQEGRSVDFLGEIVDQDGRLISEAHTTHDGMGKVAIFPVAGNEYFLRLADGTKYRLPDISMEGATIHLQPLPGRWCISVSGADISQGSGLEGSYSLILRDLQEMRHLGDIALGGGIRQFVMGENMLNPGINHLLLIAPNGDIVSERLFYVFEKDNLSCTLKHLGYAKEARSLLTNTLTLRDSQGQLLDGDCSVSVIRGSLAKHTQDDNLVSYMGLSSELRGRINEPSFYFDESIQLVQRTIALDLLMMIQGWTYYDLEWMGDPDGKMARPRSREYSQFITGRVDRALSHKTPTKFSMFVFIPRQKSINTVEVEEGSTFKMDSLDFEENTGFLIKVMRRNAGIDYIPKWDGDYFANKYKYYPAPGIAWAEEKEDDIPLVVETIVDTLQAAVVTASDDFDDLIGGHSVAPSDLELYRDRNLIEYIGMKAPSFTYSEAGMYNNRMTTSRFVTTDDEGNEISGEDDNGPGGNVKLIVDGALQDWWMFEDLLLENVAAISISKMADSFYNAPGGVVAVKLRSGVRIERNFDTEPSLAYFVPLGYQAPTKFYAPRYDRGDVSEEFDHRNTIYWNPAVKITAGRAAFRFCNTDQMDLPYLLRVEGVTANGKPFSASQLVSD